MRQHKPSAESEDNTPQPGAPTTPSHGSHRPRRRRPLLLAVLALVIALVGGLSYYWLKPAPPAKVSVVVNQPIFKVTKADLRGQTLDRALDKIAYPRSVFNDHVGDVWINDTTAANHVVLPVPPDPANWTVTAVCFRVQTIDEEAANKSLTPGQKPTTNFITLGVQRTDTITPDKLSDIIRGSYDDNLPGCSFGTSAMNVYRPDSGPTVEVN